MYSMINKMFRIPKHAGKSKFPGFLVPAIAVNIFLIVFQLVYISLRFKYLNDLIPFWFTKLWGDYQLATPAHLYYLPAISSLLLSGMLLLVYFLSRYFIRYIYETAVFFVTVWNLIITYSAVRIIFSASSPFPPLINPTYFDLLVPFGSAFLIAHTALPFFIDYVKSKDLVTDPNLHKHPGMILTKPTARGAGFLYGAAFVILSVFFVGINKVYAGLYLSVLFLSLIGIADDYQNTHPKSRYKILEKPVIRLFLITTAVSVVVFFGVRIAQVSNPFDGLIDLNRSVIKIGEFAFPYLSVIVSVLWIVWILNLLSWSNGIDGQYSGIIGISSVIIGILALRFVPLEPVHTDVSVMAMISAGIAFGFTKQTWHPSNIMWGFGAISAGLVVAVLSILVKSKVVGSVLIILIPFLDAVVTVARRVILKKSPLNGDRGHLHHILLERGWGVPRVAVFYWITTALFGIVGLVSSETYLVRAGLTLMIIVGFFIVLLNLRSIKDKTK